MLNHYHIRIFPQIENPSTGICEDPPECVVDGDCACPRYCERANNTCLNPCVRDPCGANAFGVPGDPRCHQCNCACIQGYTGNPRTGCGKIKFSGPFGFWVV